MAAHRENAIRESRIKRKEVKMQSCHSVSARASRAAGRRRAASRCGRIPQANPGTKMATAGPDWRTNPQTQIRWGEDYIQRTYGTPCQAWSFWQVHHAY